MLNTTSVLIGSWSTYQESWLIGTWILMTQNTFHLQLNFILLSRNVMSQQILIKTMNINLKSILSILILNGYYLHHSHCNLCNSPVAILWTVSHSGNAVSIWIQPVSQNEVRAAGKSQANALMRKYTIVITFLRNASTTCSYPSLTLSKSEKTPGNSIRDQSQRNSLTEGEVTFGNTFFSI